MNHLTWRKCYPKQLLQASVVGQRLPQKWPKSPLNLICLFLFLAHLKWFSPYKQFWITDHFFLCENIKAADTALTSPHQRHDSKDSKVPLLDRKWKEQFKTTLESDITRFSFTMGFSCFVAWYFTFSFPVVVSFPYRDKVWGMAAAAVFKVWSLLCSVLRVQTADVAVRRFEV